MLILKLLVSFVVVSLFWDAWYAVLGFILVKTRRFHRHGVRMLAMSCFVPASVVARNCGLECFSFDCGNWTCAWYHSPSK